MQCPAVRTPLVVAKLQPGPMGAVIPLNPAQAISSLHLSRGLQSNYGSNDAIARSRSPCDISGQICFDTVFFFFFSQVDPWANCLLQLGHAHNKSSDMPNTSHCHDMFSFCSLGGVRGRCLPESFQLPSFTFPNYDKMSLASNLHMIWMAMSICLSTAPAPLRKDLFDVVSGVGGRFGFWSTKFGGGAHWLCMKSNVIFCPAGGKL